MYECLVCKKHASDDMELCPRCNTPLLDYVGDFDEFLKKMDPFIRQHRKRFFGEVTFSVTTRRWKDEKGVLVSAGEENVLFGNAEDLWDQEVWLPQKFARIPDEKTVLINIITSQPCYSGDTVSTFRRLVCVELSNLLDAELQQIGIRLHQNQTFTVLLKNDAGKQSESAPISVLSD